MEAAPSTHCFPAGGDRFMGTNFLTARHRLLGSKPESEGHHVATGSELRLRLPSLSHGAGRAPSRRVAVWPELRPSAARANGDGNGVRHHVRRRATRRDRLRVGDQPNTATMITPGF